MSILKRKMFGGGFAHRGTGITSGLTPVRGYSHGGISKREAYAPAWQSLFGGMMSGKSLQGGWGGAFDILGQATQQSAPLFAQAAQTMAAAHEDDDKFPQFKVVGNMLVKINADGSTEIMEEYEKTAPEWTTVPKGSRLYKDGELVADVITETKDQKLYTLRPDTKLVDSTGNEVARGIVNQDTKKYRLDPGEKLFDGEGNVIAYYEDPNPKIITLNPGQKAFDADGKVLFEVPATETESKLYKLKPGEILYDKNGDEIASVPTKQEDQFITLAPGAKVFDKDTKDLVFENPTDQAQKKLVKVPPGTSLVNEEGKVIYKAPEKDRFFTLSPGQSIYQMTEDGLKLIDTAPSLADNIDTYQSNKTKEERWMMALRHYEQKYGFGDDGKVKLEDFSPEDLADYKRILHQVSDTAKADAMSWTDFKNERLNDLTHVIDMDARLDIAEGIFLRNPATGPVKAKLATLFGLVQDVTGINVAGAVNKLFGEDRDFLLEPIEATELDRLVNELSVQFQDIMKGQVSNFEVRMIMNSFFNQSKLPEANELALENMRYLNDLRRTMIEIADTVDNKKDFFKKVDEWRQANKPSILQNLDEDISDIEDLYGFEEGDLTPRM